MDDIYKHDEEELNKFPTFKPNENLKFVVGDLFQAKQKLVKYELGEIASINNLLAGSYLKMKNFHEQQIESTLYEEEEYESEKSSKTSQSSQQMMSEASRSKLNQSNSFSVGGDVSGSYGTVKFNAYADSNNNKSKQKSKETAKEFASQVLNESEEKVRERRLRQAFSRNLEIIRKEEEYGFDNRSGGHVVGIKCFVNEIHEVTLLNHNKHLFSTIMLAHPSESYKAFLKTQKISREANKDKSLDVELFYGKEKIKDSDGNLVEIPKKLTPTLIDIENWQALAFHFGVASEDLPLPPEETISIIGSAKTDSGDRKLTLDIQTVNFSIPNGYIPEIIKFGWEALTESASSFTTRIFFGNKFQDIEATHSGIINLTTSNLKFSQLIEGEDNFKIGVSHSNVYDQVTICTLECKLPADSTVYKTWQLDFYNTLKNAQKSNEEESPMAFLENLGVGKVDFKNNPSLAKMFIKNELQRCVLQQVFGTNLNGFSVLDRKTIKELEYPNCDLKKLSKLSPLLTYLNSVFDFDKMTYRFLSNYLGAKWNREEIYADTPVGPLKDFMEASFAQMILPVARGMEHRFRYFMLTNGIIFEGEDVPVIDDEVSLSILEELNDDPSLLTPEATIVSKEYLTLPSPHVMLMKDANIGQLDYTNEATKPIPANTIDPIKGESDVE